MKTWEQLSKLWDVSECAHDVYNDHGTGYVVLSDSDGNEYTAPHFTLSERFYSAYKSGALSFFDAMYENDPTDCEIMVMIALGYKKAREVE